jgi:HlyD family secretion protein
MGADRAGTRTVYMLKPGKSPSKPELEPVTIRTGITDGIFTEVLDGLKEGDSVVTGAVVPGAPPVMQPQSNPFGGGGRRGGRF